MIKGKTLRELTLEVGQTYVCVYSPYGHWTEDEEYTVVDEGKLPTNRGVGQRGSLSTFALKYPSPKTFGEMSDEEKGALLLAHQEGKVIQYMGGTGWFTVNHHPAWHKQTTYRVKPKPVEEKVVLFGHKAPTGWLFNEKQVDKDTHKQTFTLVDGISGPVKMEKV